MKLLALPKETKVPNHIAIIPDGNRRWARARGKETLKGHEAGFNRGVELARAARKMGIHTVSFWGFSTENWDRTKQEVGYLMRLYTRMLDKYIDDAHKEKVRIYHFGRRDRLPAFLIKKIDKAVEDTKNYNNYVANIALDYGGHDELIRAVQKIINKNYKPKQITKKLIEDNLDTANQPYPYVDLLIRTSGEQRTSGLLMWQAEYAELYWLSEHFPDFTPELLKEAVIDYSRRRRRFGANDKEDHFKFKPEVAARLELNWWRLANIPEGTGFRDYAIKHIKEQWGLSTKLAGDAAKLMAEAALKGEKNNWKQARDNLRLFYRLIKEEVSLAFEPSLAASLEIKIWQSMTKNGPDSLEKLEQNIKAQLSEVYRISGFQASKAAHLKALATQQRQLAEAGKGEHHWVLAEDYLEKYYEALKERIA